MPSNIALCQYTLHGLPHSLPIQGNCATYSLGRLVLLRRPTARSIRSLRTISRRIPSNSSRTRVLILSRTHFAPSGSITPLGRSIRRLPLSSHCGARGQAVLYHLLVCRCVVAYGREWYEPILVIGLTYIGCSSDQYRSRRKPI